MVSSCKCAFRKHHIQLPAFQTKKSNRAGYFVYKMAINEKNIRSVLNFSNNVGIPHFIEQGAWGFTHFQITFVILLQFLKFTANFLKKARKACALLNFIKSFRFAFYNLRLRKPIF